MSDEQGAIPEGMVAWHGGDSAPADWDGGAVMWHDGEMTGATKGHFGWLKGLRFRIIAYTPAADRLTDTGEGWRLAPVGDPVSLNECPPGPFEFNGGLGFKTEYGAARWLPERDAFTVSHWPDPYCLESGEAFWGGVSGQEARAALVVQPLAASLATPKPPVDAGAMREVYSNIITRMRLPIAEIINGGYGDPKHKVISAAGIQWKDALAKADKIIAAAIRNLPDDGETM